MALAIESMHERVGLRLPFSTPLIYVLSNLQRLPRSSCDIAKSSRRDFIALPRLFKLKRGGFLREMAGIYGSPVVRMICSKDRLDDIMSPSATS
jgi:hypothetical protein